jgi:hypothetical protein
MPHTAILMLDGQEYTFAHFFAQDKTMPFTQLKLSDNATKRSLTITAPNDGGTLQATGGSFRIFLTK